MALFNEFKAPTYDEWKAAAKKALAPKGEATVEDSVFDKKLLTKTYEEITLKPIYNAEDVKNSAFAGALPGDAPYVRAVSVGGYITNPWVVAQECDQATAAEVNKALKSELPRGLQAVGLRLDCASRLATDPDKAPDGQVGSKGVSVSTLKDVKTILDGVDANTPFRVDAGVSALPFIAFAVAAKAKLSGVIGADPVGTLAKYGEVPASLDSLYDQLAATTNWAEKNAPALKTIVVDTSSYNNAGANAVQELAYAMATAVEYIEQLGKRGVSFKVVAKHLQLAFSIGSNLFMEIAKIRAARILWNEVVTAYGESGAEVAANIHVKTAHFTKTVYDYHVNMLRSTTEAFSGVVGGANSMHVGTFDEAVRRGDDFSRRIARNVQILLREECGLVQPIDPAGGSYYIESITEDLAKRAWELLGKIDADGGMVKALEKGTPQADVAKVLAAREKKLANRSDVVVGNNNYVNLAEKPLAPEKPVDVAAIKKAVAANRKSGAASSLKAGTDASVVDAAIKAAEAGASTGEIVAALKGNGSPAKVAKLNASRRTEVFEKLREKTAANKSKNVKVFLGNFGPIPQHKGRADFSRSFFEVGAFEVVSNDGFDAADKLADEAGKAKPDVVVICSSDKLYPENVPAIAKAVKAKASGAKVFLAGKPADATLEKAYKDAGVDDFIYMGVDCLKVLTDLQKAKGI
ncbi:methylmalonyl-CoA mutase family protein [Deferribacterales bacterium RsTz2092]|nr:methylmalonyl-CoA mutase [Deferribacterales bacterium]